MLKNEHIWLFETGQDEFPWLVGRRGRITPTGALPQPNLGVFSDSDIRHLQTGFDRARGMTFDERTRETHGSDWKQANLGMMDYADMVEGTDREEKIEDMRAVAARAVI